MKEKINCLDLRDQHQNIKSEIFEAFERVYDATAFSGGKFVEEFENKFSEFCQTKYAIGVNNGTSALHLAMLSLGIGPGDEVIIPANTFIATAWCVSYTGATPVFVDCHPQTWQINHSIIEKYITAKTKAIIGVHLYGQPFEISAIKEICLKYKLFLVEDAAQAQGALYNGKPVGGFGDIACFSFYPGKNLGACGEAGGITTNSEIYNAHIHSLRNHGSTTRYYHDEIGFNMRMGGLEAASLTVKLKYLREWNNKRKIIADLYNKQISKEKFIFQKQPEGTSSIYHLFVITTSDRDHLLKYLNENQIYPGLHYPVPCHLQKAYAYLGYKKGDCPNAEYLSEHCISLPMYAELKDHEIQYIIDTLNRY